MASIDKIRVDFVCVHNAGRSQMAAAFAERERAKRGLGDIVDIHSGGTDPADTVHKGVVEAMAEAGVDIADKTPKYVADTDYLVAMGAPSRNSTPRSMASSRTSGIS